MTAQLGHIKGKFVDGNGNLTKQAYDFLLALESKADEAQLSGEDAVQQAGDVVNQIFQSGAGGGAKVGDIKMSGKGDADHSGWLYCDGRAISRITYSALFAVVSDKYGVGDGLTTFNIPNFELHSAMGKGTGLARGATAGSNTVDLSHTHDVTVTSENVEADAGNPQAVGADDTYATTSAGDSTHDNRHQVVGVNFFIKY